jgi:hypothetical protein
MVEIRYLVKFSDGGVGMRTRSEPLEVGEELDDCGERYTVVEVEQPPDARSHESGEVEELDAGPQKRA